MIFSFSHYRSFLKDYLKRLPKQGFGESKRIAEYLEVSSTYVSHVLNGTKDFSLEQAVLVSSYLGLNGIEADYFYYLVQKARAGNETLRRFCDDKLEDLKKKSLKLVNRVEAKKKLNELERSIFYSSPLYSAIHIYTATNKSGKSADEIARRFEISRSKATEIAQFLLQAGLVSEEKSRYLVSSVGTHLENGSPYLLKHHTNWRLRAIQAAENLNEQELMYTVNVALSQKDFAELREEMVGFVQNFLTKVYPSPSEEIACFNMDWYWIRK